MPAKRYATYSRLLTLLLRGLDGLLAWGMPRPRRGPDAGTSAPERILLCNQGHLGDVILASALIPAIRSAWPGARLGVLIHPGSAALIETNPEVDWVHTVEHWHLNRRDTGWWRRWRRHRTSQARALAEIRARDYHLALDCHPFFPNSIPLLWRAGIARRVGWTGAGFGRLLHTAVEETRPAPNMLARHARLLSAALGAPVDARALRPRLILSEQASRTWAELRRALGLPDNFVALHVGAHAAYKRWPAAQWCLVVQALAADGWTVVLLGASPDEVKVCEDLAASCPSAVDLSGCLSLDQLLVAIADCRLLLAHDSVAAHMASAFERPRVCLVPGIQDPTVWHRPEAGSVVLTQPVPCAPCHRRNGCEAMTCLSNLPADRVIQAARDLLTAPH